MLLTMKNHHRNETGFTLIELLVVILIIGILSAVAIPVFLNQRMAAYAAIVNPAVHSVESWAVANPSVPVAGNEDYLEGDEFASLLSEANKGMSFPSDIIESDASYKLKPFGSHGETYELCFFYGDEITSYTDIYVYDSESDEIEIALQSQC